MRARFYDYILEGHEATFESAISSVFGLDWSEIECTEQDLPYMEFKENVNGIGIYYCYGTDSMHFTDER